MLFLSRNKGESLGQLGSLSPYHLKSLHATHAVQLIPHKDTAAVSLPHALAPLEFPHCRH